MLLVTNDRCLDVVACKIADRVLIGTYDGADNGNILGELLGIDDGLEGGAVLGIIDGVQPGDNDDISLGTDDGSVLGVRVVVDDSVPL